MGRRSTRDQAIVPVRLWGMDVNGQPFIEAAWTGNVSADGALLKGIRRTLQPGDTIGITYLGKKTRLRVIWVGQTGSPEQGHVALQALSGRETCWLTPLRNTFAEVYRRSPENERRQTARLKCDVKARVHARGQEFAVWGTVEDLCSGGCYVNTTMSLETGSELNLCLFVSNYKLWIDGIAISSHEGAGVGIKFTRMDRQCREWLEDSVGSTLRPSAQPAD
jgi:PilZ domain